MAWKRTEDDNDRSVFLTFPDCLVQLASACWVALLQGARGREADVPAVSGPPDPHYRAVLVVFTCFHDLMMPMMMQARWKSLDMYPYHSLSLHIYPSKKRSQNITGCWWWIINAHQSLQQYKGILMHLGWTSWRESDPLPTVAHEAWSQKDGPSSRRTWLRQRGWVTRTGTARNQAIEPALEGVSVNISWKNPEKWIVDFLGSFNSKIINRMGWYHPKWIQVHVWQWMGWPRWISNMKR